MRPPLEAQLIDCVDEIAYNTADLDDAREAGLLELDALRSEVTLFAESYAAVNSAYPSGRGKLKFNEALKRVLDIFATDLIETTIKRIQDSGVESVDDVRRAPRRLTGFSEEIAARHGEVKRFLFAHVYDRAVITEDRDRSVRCLEEMFRYYLTSPGSMPPSHEELTRTEPRHVAVCDYIAGMTDQFLLRQHREHFGAAAASG